MRGGHGRKELTLNKLKALKTRKKDIGEYTEGDLMSPFFIL